MLDFVEQLRVLEEMFRRSIGEDSPYVCRTCYAEFDPTGCPCKREAWTPIAVVIVEIRLRISEENQNKEPQLVAE